MKHGIVRSSDLGNDWSAEHHLKDTPEAEPTPPVPAELEGLVAPGEDYYTTDQMRELYTVEGFAAPWVLVRRKSDGQPGTLSFTHMPRYYYDWQPSR